MQIESVKKKYICSICPAHFDERLDFLKHIMTHRAPNFSALFFCNICSHGFTDKVDLYSHLLSHKHPIHTYKCKNCNRNFVLKRQLEQHEIHCKAFFTPKNDCESGKCLASLKNRYCNGGFSCTSANVNVTESCTFNDDFEDHEFQFSIKQTYSGRTIKAKKIYDSDDCDTKGKKKSALSEYHHSGSENSPKSFKSSVSSNCLTIPGKELKILSPKLSKHIYEKCMENGFISVSAIGESCNEISHPTKDENITNSSCNDMVAEEEDVFSCVNNKDLNKDKSKKTSSNLSKKFNLRSHDKTVTDSSNIIPSQYKTNVTVSKNIDTSIMKQNALSSVLDENFFFRNKHLICAGKEVQELIVSSKSVAEKLANCKQSNMQVPKCSMQYPNVPNVCNQSQQSLLIKNINFGDQQLQIVKISSPSPSGNTLSYSAGKSGNMQSSNHNGILQSYLLNSKTRMIKVTPQFMNQLKKSTIKKGCYSIKDGNMIAKQSKTPTVNKSMKMSVKLTKTPLPKRIVNVTLDNVSPISTGFNVGEISTPNSSKSNVLMQSDKNVIDSTQNLKLQGIVRKQTDKILTKKRIEKREIILNKCLMKLRERDKKKLEKYKLKRKLRFLEKFFERCRNRCCDESCYEFLPPEINANTDHPMVDTSSQTDFVSDVDQSAHNDEMDPYANISTENQEKRDMKCTCNSKDCDWSQHTMEEEKLSFVELTDELTLKSTDLILESTENVSVEIQGTNQTLIIDNKASKQEALDKMLFVNEKIKKNLSVSHTDVQAALNAMQELEDMDLSSGMWKKSLVVLKTIKACKKYKGNESVRQKAKCIYEKFKKFYLGQL